MTHTGLEEELLPSDEPMPFNDRPYFRRLLDFDDLVRRGRPVTCESLAGKPFRFKVRVAKEIAPWITEVRWHPAQKLEALKNDDFVLDLPAGSLIEAKRFVLSLGRFGKALGPKELVGEMKREIRAMIAGVNT
jgi:WYL domain